MKASTRLACTALMAASLATSWGVSTARADVLLARTWATPIVFGGASYTVDFNGGGSGGTQFDFTTTQANTRVAIFFNAECAVDGATTNWVDIDILVDPAGPTAETITSPSNGDNALCSGNGNTTGSGGNFSLDGWVSAATITTLNLPSAGTHQIRVRVLGGNAGIARLDDMSLIVMD